MHPLAVHDVQLVEQAVQLVDPAVLYVRAGQASACMCESGCTRWKGLFPEIAQQCIWME